MRGFFFVARWVLAIWMMVLVGCGGGGGSGSSDSSAEPSPQVVTSLRALDEDALDGLLDEEAYLTQLEQILAMNDAQADGMADLADYLENEVAGQPLDFRLSANAAPRPVNWGETIDKIKGSTTYQMLEAFVTTVGSSLLLPDPVSTILDLGKPEVFVSLSSVLVRTHIYDAIASNQVNADQGSQLLGELQTNPYGAQRSLMTATSQEIPAWLAAADGCFRGCPGVYNGPFSVKFNELWMGCQYEHTLSGQVGLDIYGDGTMADPYGGTFDMTGTLVTVLKAGSDCQGGGDPETIYFSGTVSGDSGKLDASGSGTAGTGFFVADIISATVSTSTITGTLRFDFYGDATPSQTVTLTQK